MSLIFTIFSILAASIVLIKAVDWFILSVSKIAHYFRLSGYTISFFLIGAATSFPELVIGIVSAYEKRPILSYANVIGSNMALLTLIIAIPVLLGAEISTRRIVHSKDLYITLFCFVFALALTLDGKLTRIDGIALIIGYVLYTTHVIRSGSVVEKIAEKLEHVRLDKQLAIFTASVIVVMFSSEVIVQSAFSLSQILGWNIAFIGVTLTAIGTSLPEITYAIKVMNDPWKRDGIIGNTMGSVVANSLLVLGTTVLIQPLTISDNQVNIPTITILFFTLLLFLNFARTKTKLDKKEAIILLCIYAIFVLMEYYLTA